MEKKNIVHMFRIDSDAFIACEFCLLGKMLLVIMIIIQ